MLLDIPMATTIFTSLIVLGVFGIDKFDKSIFGEYPPS